MNTNKPSRNYPQIASVSSSLATKFIRQADTGRNMFFHSFAPGKRPERIGFSFPGSSGRQLWMASSTNAIGAQHTFAPAATSKTEAGRIPSRQLSYTWYDGFLSGPVLCRHGGGFFLPSVYSCQFFHSNPMYRPRRRLLLPIECGFGFVSRPDRELRRFEPDAKGNRFGANGGTAHTEPTGSCKYRIMIMGFASKFSHCSPWSSTGQVGDLRWGSVLRIWWLLVGVLCWMQSLVKWKKHRISMFVKDPLEVVEIYYFMIHDTQ